MIIQGLRYPKILIVHLKDKKFQKMKAKCKSKKNIKKLNLKDVIAKNQINKIFHRIVKITQKIKKEKK